LITISIAHPNSVPLYNVYSQLAYATKAPDVEDVFINGRQIVSGRKVLTLHQDEIYKKAVEYKMKIMDSLKH
jgi:5-methylthioadenosine/S-adenosylhomocysteine deaminase